MYNTAGFQAGDGIKIVTNKSKDQVWAIVMELTKKIKLEMSECDKEKGIIRGWAAPGKGSLTATMAIFIYVSEKNPSKIVISVVSSPAWTSAIISDIREELDILD